MLKRIFPFLNWFHDYNLSKFRADFLSGLTVALVLIPQSMAYAQLAGLPAYYGLYAAFLPPMVAALFGSSLQLATGPVAVVSLMTAAALEPMATTGSPAFIAYAILMALVVGFFQLALGLLRLGMIVNFLSHPVVNGFTNAAAIIIASSQFSKLFGVYVDGAEHHYETIIRVAEAAVHYTHWPSFALAVFAFVIMYGLKRINPRIPFVLVAVAVTSVIAWATGFQHDTKASIEQIHSEQVHQSIARFNEQIDLIEATGKRRTEIGAQLIQEEKTGGAHSSQALDLKHEMDLIALTLARHKEKSHEIREALRRLYFRGVATDGGGLEFYLNGEAPSDARDDGRHWRIKVGNKKLDEKALTFTGGGAVVADVPKGLPAIGIPKVDLSAMLRFLPIAAIISLLGFMEAISIAKAMAAKTGQKLDPNQELIGQGLANIVGAIGQSYPVSGSFSRSAVNLGAGAVTGLSSVITSLIVVITLIFFTPLLYYIPQSVLAAVIMMAVVGLINVKGFIHAYRAQKYDGIIAVISFLCTLAFAPHLDRGIMVGVVLSLGHYLYRNTKPTVSVLSMHPDCSLRQAQRHGLKECRHIAVIRFEGPLFFANVSYLEDKISERVDKMPEIRHILVVGHGLNEIDASGEEMLALLVERLRARGIDISFTGLNENVLDLLRRTHLMEKIGEKNIFPTPAMALAVIHEPAHVGSTETECPLQQICFIDPEKYKQGEPLTQDFKTLIVDDEEEFVMTTSRRFKKKGLAVRSATHPKEALEILKKERFEVVLMDVRMPELSGIDLLKMIHEQWPETRVILLTGHSSVEDAFVSGQYGAFAYLIKPCTFETIMKEINRAVIDIRTKGSKGNRS